MKRQLCAVANRLLDPSSPATRNMETKHYTRASDPRFRDTSRALPSTPLQNSRTPHQLLEDVCWRSRWTDVADDTIAVLGGAVKSGPQLGPFTESKKHVLPCSSGFRRHHEPHGRRREVGLSICEWDIKAACTADASPACTADASPA